jgi:hypothetical protein
VTHLTICKLAGNIQNSDLGFERTCLQAWNYRRFWKVPHPNIPFVHGDMKRSAAVEVAGLGDVGLIFAGGLEVVLEEVELVAVHGHDQMPRDDRATQLRLLSTQRRVFCKHSHNMFPCEDHRTRRVLLLHPAYVPYYTDSQHLHKTRTLLRAATERSRVNYACDVS